MNEENSMSDNGDSYEVLIYNPSYLRCAEWVESLAILLFIAAGIFLFSFLSMKLLKPLNLHEYISLIIVVVMMILGWRFGLLTGALFSSYVHNIFIRIDTLTLSDDALVFKK